jgi:hypothetical protein
MAQVGSRLIDAASSKIAEDFFTAFEARLQAVAVGAPPPASAPTASRNNAIWWAVGAAIVLAAIYFLTR